MMIVAISVLKSWGIGKYSGGEGLSLAGFQSRGEKSSSKDTQIGLVS